MNIRQEEKIEQKGKYKSGNWRGEKVKYHDGIGCAVWKPFDPEKEDSIGICMDFVPEDIPDLIDLLNNISTGTYYIYEPDPELEKFEEKREKREKTRIWQFWNKIRNVGIALYPFEWRFAHGGIFAKKPHIHKKLGLGFELTHGGIHIGPITISW